MVSTLRLGPSSRALASRTVFNDTHIIAQLINSERSGGGWVVATALRPSGNIVFGATITTSAELPREGTA